MRIGSPSGRPVYQFFGLAVAIYPPLEGIPFDDFAQPDVEIECRSSDAIGTEADSTCLLWRTVSRDFAILEWPGICRVEVEGGEMARVLHREDMPRLLIQSLVLGAVLGMLAYQRGAVVLHASAVTANGHAIVMCGATGAGKSTLAAAFLSRGWLLLSDDTVALDIVNGGILVQRSSPLLKIDQSAHDTLRLGPGEAYLLGAASRDRMILAAREQAPLTAKVLALVSIDDIGRIGCRWIPSHDRISLLLPHATPSRFGFLPDQDGLRKVAEISVGVNAWSVTRGSTPDTIATLVDELIGRISESAGMR